METKNRQPIECECKDCQKMINKQLKSKQKIIYRQLTLFRYYNMLKIHITRIVQSNNNLLGTCCIEFIKNNEKIAMIANSIESGTKYIPSGTYKLKRTYSAKFKRSMLLVENVPERSGIRIHPFNSGNESKGCISIGIKQRNIVTCTTETCEYLEKLYQRDPQGEIEIIDNVHTTTQNN